MKRIIFCLAMMAPVAVFAQSGQDNHQATTTNMEATRSNTKAVLANKVEELNATVGRNNEEVTNKVMMDLMASMQRYISMEANNMEKGQEAATKKKIEKLNAIYSDVKMMSVNPAANQQGIQSKVDEFIKQI